MQLYREQDAPHVDVRQTFRESPWMYTVMSLLFAGLGVAWLVVAVVADLPLVLVRLLLGLVGICCVFVTLFGLGPAALAAFGPANWIVRYGTDGLLIKFRSFANRHFPPEDPVVVFLAPTEIAAVGRATERRSKPGARGQGDTVHRLTYLDIHLTHEDTAELEAALKRERALPPMGGRIMRSKTQHYPVSVPAPGVVRVEWGGTRSRVRPGIATALRTFEGLARAEPDVEVDRGDWTAMSPAELETYLCDLVESGDVLAATKIARRRYGYSLTAAKRFVDELQGRGEARDAAG